jgi:hypothetical protein
MEVKARTSHINGKAVGTDASKEDQIAHLRAAHYQLELKNVTLQEENNRLKEELDTLRANSAAEAMAADASPSASKTPKEQHSEGRLRAVLTDKTTTATQLREAIASVKALVDQSDRELGQMEFRERRAAHEALYAAMEKADEVDLEIALGIARLKMVNDDDIDKGQAKLDELRSLSPEQKAAKLANKRENENKKEAYLLVKRNDPQALRTLLESLDTSVRWNRWRDYAGRDLWKAAVELRADKVQEYLGPVLGMTVPVEARNKRGSVVSQQSTKRGSTGSAEFVRQRTTSSDHVPDGQRSSPSSPQVSPVPLADDVPPIEPSIIADCTSPTSKGPNLISIASPSPATGSEGTDSPSRHWETPGDDELAELKAKALKAVVQDDAEALEEILDGVPKDVWSKWENKAGKDLLCLSQERGTSSAYSSIARHLGILKELVREAFEENEDVWVFENGEVQPKRAKVMEDTPTDQEEVLVQFWDGDDEPVRVDRCAIRKIGS